MRRPFCDSAFASAAGPPDLRLARSCRRLRARRVGCAARRAAGGGREVLFDAGDVRVRRVVGDLVVDVDLVHDRGAELGLVFGDEQDPGRVARRSRPLDHHRDARGLEAAPEHLRLHPRATRRAPPGRCRRRGTWLRRVRAPPGNRGTAWCQRGIRPRTRGTRGSVRSATAGVYARPVGTMSGCPPGVYPWRASQ